jgi:hypothetical protein
MKDAVGSLLEELSHLTKPSDMPQAVTLCRTALTLVSRDSQPELWVELQVKLGNSLVKNPLGDRAKNLEQAIHHYQRALEIRTAKAFPQQCWDTAYLLGYLLYDEHRFAKSRTVLTTAHKAVEALRGETQRDSAKRDLAEQNTDLYARLVHCCLLGSDVKAAFEYAVAGKGRAFVDLLVTTRFDLSAAGADDPELAEDLREIRKLSQQIGNLRAQLSPNQ